MKKTLPPVTLPASIIPHLLHITDFVHAFPPKQMSSKIIDFIHELVKDKEEDELPELLSRYIHQSYLSLKAICTALEGVAKEMEQYDIYLVKKGVAVKQPPGC